MKKRLFALCFIAGCAIVGFRVGRVAAQSTPTLPPPAPEPTDPSLVYNPYPAGILPADLNSEILRVRREVRGIELEAISQWLVSPGLPPLMLAGNPPIQQGSGIPAIELLGKLFNYDENMSTFKNRACAFCHLPYAAFSGPIPSVNLTMVAYPGSLLYTAAKRSAQRYTYSPFFPSLHFNTTQGLFAGGNFWDGRATGYQLRSPDGEQAQHPPVCPLEMEFPDSACVAFRLQTAVYKPLFLRVFGAGSLDITFPTGTEQICDTPGPASKFNGSNTPIPLSIGDRDRANQVYFHWGQALNAFEHSDQVSPFTSKFDAATAPTPTATLTADEMAGFQLFNGKANCNSCHLDGLGTTLMPGQVDTSTDNSFNPVFTCFGNANEGLPLNPRLPLFYETMPTFVGFTPNSLGFGFRDLGYGTFLRSGPQSAPNPNSNWIQLAPANDGFFQVMTTRNVAMAPPQCPTTEAPGPYFQKGFFHNGYIKSLKQLVHFYNTRDVFAFPVTSGHCPPGTVERVTCWPEPEVQNMVDPTTGMLGLTDTEENQIVAFLMTLTDGFTTPYPDRNTFTGTCMTGGTAATQGNNTIIPTPAGIPCAAAICGVPPLPVGTIPPT